MKRPEDSTFQIASRIHDHLVVLLQTDQLWLHEELSNHARSMERLLGVYRKLVKCSDRRLIYASAKLNLEAGQLLRSISGNDAFSINAEQLSRRKVPSLKELYQELQQLRAEFTDWYLDGDVLYVVTDRIVLHDVELGEFEIRLPIFSIGNARELNKYQVVAVSPNPAAKDSNVTHPHVSGEQLCGGDATSAIQASLRHCRITDFFLLVNSVLYNYNRESPYVALEDWEGGSCNECGATVYEDTRNFCEGCDLDFCNECYGYCVTCERDACCVCLDVCEVCNEHVCSNCLRPCSQCDLVCCAECINDSFCPTCFEKKESEDEDEEELEDEGPGLERVEGDSSGEQTICSATPTTTQ